MDMRFINSCNELPWGTHIRIYGSGAKGLGLMNTIRDNRPDLKILGFLDSLKEGDVEGLPRMVFSGPLENPNELIVVCSCHYPEIGKKLLAEGVTNFVVFQDEKAPTTLVLDIVDKCNGDCIFCSASSRRDKFNRKPWGMKEFSAVEKYVMAEDEICFSCAFGEPLLNREILPMLERCKALGKRTSIFTNGSTLRDTPFIRSVIEQTDILNISFVSTRDEISKRFMGAVSGQAVYDNMRRIADKDITIRMNTLVMSENLDHLSEIYKFYCEVNVAHATFTLMRHDGLAAIQDVVITKPTVEQKEIFYEQFKNIEELLSVDSDNARFSISGNLLEVFGDSRVAGGTALKNEGGGKVLTRICCLPWSNRFVYTDGLAVPCCLTAQAVGNVFDDDDCFGNDKHRALQEALLSGNLNAVCRNCLISPMGPVEELVNTLKGMGMMSN